MSAERECAEAFREDPTGDGYGWCLPCIARAALSSAQSEEK